MGIWIELGVFLVALAFGLWQIQDVKKAQAQTRRQRELEQQQQLQREREREREVGLQPGQPTGAPEDGGAPSKRG